MDHAATGPLTLIQAYPDRDALARWAATRGWLGRTSLRQGEPDLGYAWHAVLKAVFGPNAPQPFVDRQPLRANQLLGYWRGPGSPKETVVADPLAAQAIGLDSVRANALPTDWTPGQTLSFEVRARPVVRTRQRARSGTVDEVDIAPYRAQSEPGIDRETAYTDWLRRELEREGAAELGTVRMSLFRRTRVFRRSHDAARAPTTVEGPEAWLCGHLRVAEPHAFTRLLRRGVGRHRAFGYGCLLVAPPGVLD